MQVLWECGGTLAAPAIAAGVIHKALAFIAPKLVSDSSVALKSPISCCCTSLFCMGIRVVNHRSGHSW